MQSPGKNWKTLLLIAALALPALVRAYANTARNGAADTQNANHAVTDNNKTRSVPAQGGTGGMSGSGGYGGTGDGSGGYGGTGGGTGGTSGGSGGMSGGPAPM
jgi:hypothetical protein